MKQNRLFKFCVAIVICLMASTVAFAQEMVFSVDRHFVAPGETATITLNVKTTEKLTAFSGHIVLPEGLSFVTSAEDAQVCIVEKTDLSKSADVSLTIGKSNSQDAALYVGQLRGFKPMNGALVKFTVKAAENIDVNNEVKYEDFKGCVSTTVYNQNFVASIFNANYEATPSMKDIEIKAGETKKVAVALNFDKAQIHSLQFNFVLPEGLTIDEDSYDVTDRNPKHQVLPTVNDGVAVLAPFSDPDSYFFIGTEGSFLTFDVTASQDFKDSQLKIVNFRAESMETSYFGKDVVVNVGATITGIDAINADKFAEAADGIYQLNGVRTDKMQRGVNIVVKDGKAVKVVKK